MEGFSLSTVLEAIMLSLLILGSILIGCTIIDTQKETIQKCKDLYPSNENCTILYSNSHGGVTNDR